MTGWAEFDRARQCGRKERFALSTLMTIAVNANLTDLETKKRDRDQAKVTTINFSNTKGVPGRQCDLVNATTSLLEAVSVVLFPSLSFQTVRTRQT